MDNNRVFAGRYRITEKVGTGGMAEVYKAYDEVLGRVVAVKVMLPQYASDPTFTARFRQEAQAAANLSSPYIVNIYDWGQDEDTYFIVMEFVHGIELKRAIRERGALSERKVAEIASQVCQALSVAHQYDIIHRDIKPQNIMVQPDGNAKVMDFGIARAGNSNLTTTNSVLGTAHYVSPEQAQGKRLTYASDLYSLGVVMYEASTGQLPFDAPDAVAVAVKQVNEQPVPPRQINPKLSPAFESIVMQAMSKNPEERYASALDMKNTIDAYLAGGYNAATVPMNRQNFGAGTQVMPAAAAGTQQQTGRFVSAEDSEGKDKKGKKKRKKGPIIAIIVILALLIGLGIWIALANSGPQVPNIVGKSQSEAEQTLTSAGFTVGTVSSENSSKVASGNVISQDPKANTRKKTGTAINLVVSKGTAETTKVTVPDLSGMSEDQAKAALSSVNLTPVRGTDAHDSSIAAGKVCSQNPAKSTTVDAGSTVTYVISLGPDTVTVPDVTGKSKSSAVSALNAVGIEASADTKYSDTVDEGYVISQSPSSGSSVDKGSTVTIVVSKGSDPNSKVDVPNLTGDTLSEAKSELSSIGLSITFDGPESNSTVSSYSPSGSVAKGSTIHVILKSATSGGTTPGA